MFLERTIDDLEIEFWLDYYEEHPLEAYRNADGEVQFYHPDDALFNKWEEQIARGETPDLTEAFDQETLDKLRARAKRKKGKLLSQSMTFKEVADMVAREQSTKESPTSARRKRVRPPPTFGTGLMDE